MKVGASRLEDCLAPWEPPYRSRGEAQVGRLLDRYGIPFFYEHPAVVHDRGRERVWHPDFTLPTCRRLIVEYAGMPERPEYMAGVRHKKQAYAVNGLAAVFLYPGDLRGRDWPQRVLANIARYGPIPSSSHRGPMRHRAMSVDLHEARRRPPYCRSRGYRR